jgi:hypothetical protein
VNIDNVIMQLRNYVPAFHGNVAGAGEFSNGLPLSANLPLPAAYVIPDSDEILETINSLNPLQYVKETIVVYIEIDNTADRRGQTSADQVESLKYAVHAALLNWKDPNDFSRNPRGLYFGGANRAQMDGARLYWEMKYYRTIQLTGADGFIPPNGDLNEIDLIDSSENILASATNLQNAATYCFTSRISTE